MRRVLRFPRITPTIRMGERQLFNLKVVQHVIDKVNKKYHKKSADGVLSSLKDSIFSTPRIFVRTGIRPFDMVVSYGQGLPSGIIEIFGPEGSGKTAVLEKMLAEAQRRGYYTTIFPTEYSLNYRRVKTVGLNDEMLMVGDAVTIEDVYERLRDIVTSIREEDQDTPIVMGWDSVAATPTRNELKSKKGRKNSLDQSDMGGAARQISRLFRRMVRFLFKNNVCLVCINQTRTNLAQRYGDPETTYGGKALKFYAWVRCRISRIGIIKGRDDNEIGFMCKLKTIKNKFGAAPLKTCLVPIYWDRGIDNVRAVWEYSTSIGVLKLKGRFYRFDGKVVTKKKFDKFYENNRKLIDKLMIRETLLKERGEGE
jgi:recombination protein RecA